jgi:hypothetical protein
MSGYGAVIYTEGWFYPDSSVATPNSLHCQVKSGIPVLIRCGEVELIPI